MLGPWSTGGAQRRRLRRESPARSTGRELRSGDGKALNASKAAPRAASATRACGHECGPVIVSGYDAGPVETPSIRTLNGCK